MKYEDLPETITPELYQEWRGGNLANIREYFKRKDFPRLKGTGSRLKADKRAVLMYELGIDNELKNQIIKEIVR